MRGAEHEARARVAGHDPQDLAGLLCGTAGVAFEQSLGMSERDLECSDRLRRITQFPVLCMPATGERRIKACAAGLSNAARGCGISRLRAEAFPVRPRPKANDASHTAVARLV
jgi:hypothetical protein